MNGDILHKISSEAVWHTVRSGNFLFRHTLNEVSFNIIHSVHNSIIFGITTQSTEFQKGFIPSASVPYHLNNRHIYDMDPVSKANRWRSGGKPVMKGSYASVRMIVDMV
jgi:hypothetical protein